MPTPAIKADFPFWQLPDTALLGQLAASANGLSSAEAAERLASFGPNLIRRERKQTLVLQFLSRFRNPLVILLLVASAISALTGEVTSFLIILAMVLLSVTLDFVQEYRAGQAAESLRQSVSVRASVMRDGKPLEVPVTEVVPGDVVLLSAGDLIPADGRVFEANDFFVNQALLTGESYPVEKQPGDLPRMQAISRRPATPCSWAPPSSAAWPGYWSCRTGAGTAIGEIADTLTRKPPPTAFEIGTHRFGMLIMRLTVLLVLFVFLVNALLHRPCWSPSCSPSRSPSA